MPDLILKVAFCHGVFGERCEVIRTLNKLRTLEHQVAWSNYLRSLLKVGCMYSFFSLRVGHYFMIAEHKIFAGREMLTEDAAVGRPLSIAWFEKKDTSALGDQSKEYGQVSLCRSAVCDYVCLLFTFPCVWLSSCALLRFF
jgi:hypothetical protein